MGVIRRADAEQFVRDAVVLDLGRLEAQGDALVSAARRRAEEIVAEARAERERLISDASAVGHAEGAAAGRAKGLEQGLAQGRAEGLAAAAERLAQLEQAWCGSLDAFEGSRADMLADARDDLVRLACEIARRATARVLEQDPSVVVEQLSELLGCVVDSTTLRVRVHPDDEPFVAEALPRLRARLAASTDVSLSTDPALPRGSCVADTGRGGVIDASIETKLARLIEALVPGGSA
jgi:flagellar assembly protein FliH